MIVNTQKHEYELFSKHPASALQYGCILALKYN